MVLLSGFKPIFIADIDKDAMLTSANRLKDLKFKGEDISKICHTLDLNVKEVPKQFKEIKFPKIDVLLEYCQNKKIKLFGVSAKYIDHLKNEKFDCSH